MIKTKELNKIGVGAHDCAQKEQGITLIALVITIIVMLILVAVTITMAVNGGLFEYAGNAGTQTNAAIANEQELANLEANMTVDELIDKYTAGSNGGVDLSLVNVGDYISNYPVEYTNVDSVYNMSTGEGSGWTPKDEFTGWRVLSKVKDGNGNVLYVKLVSAGVPLNYYHPYESGAGLTSKEKLTTSFLSTEINSNTMEKYKFYKCGFNIGESTNLGNVFVNEFSNQVQALTKDDIDYVVDEENSPTGDGDYINDAKYEDLLAVPSIKREGSYAFVHLASNYGNDYLWYVRNGCVTSGQESDAVYGVRVVITLKPDVKFTAVLEEEKINDTTTWKISI